MIQITPPQNPQYWINQRALTFSENDLENVNRIAVRLVSGTVIMVYEKGVIDYAPDGNFQKWTLKGYSTRLVSNLAHHIYARLSRTEKDALIVFSINNYNIDGSITTILTDASGNPVLDEDGKEQTTTSEPNPNYWYVKIGEITATNGASNRELTYDSGALGTSKGVEESAGWNEMFELSKQSTPWLIFVKQMFYEFTVKNPITLLSGLIFKNSKGVEKKVTDVKRSTDSDNEYLLDEEGNIQKDENGNELKDPDYVPISDETIPTTAYMEKYGKEKHLSRLEEDSAKKKITFLEGIEIGEKQKGILPDKESGKVTAVIDELRKLLHVESEGFSAGELGNGFLLNYDEEKKRSYLEVDEILVRKLAYFVSLVIKELKHVGGTIILTPASITCSKVEIYDTFYRCYFEQDDGEKSIENEFEPGDFARCQTFNIKEGTSYNVNNTYYWRCVVDKGDNYIDLSIADCDEGSGMPQKGDEIVQLGNRYDESRQNAIILSTVGKDAPSIKQYKGINEYDIPDSKAVTILSPFENKITGKLYSSATNQQIDKMVDDLKVDWSVVKEQVDQEFTIWFFDYEPSLENYPAVEWYNDELKKMHDQDIFYDKSSGRAYRFEDGLWVEITDADTIAALEKAAKAQESANKAQFTADYASNVAEAVTERVNSIVSDNILSAVEKKSVRKEFEEIMAEYARNIKTAEVFGITIDGNDEADAYIKTYESNYIALGSYMNDGSWNKDGIPSWISDGNLETDQQINAGEYRNAWVSYYDSERELLNYIAELSKKVGDDVTNKINNIVKDGILSALEKKEVLKEFESVMAEYSKNESVSNTFKLEEDSYWLNYKSAYFDLGSYMNEGLWDGASLPKWLSTDLSKDTPITASEYRSSWVEYYESSKDFSNHLSELSKDRIDEIVADGILSALEKKEVLKEWEAIVANYSENISNASKYAVSYTDYKSAYESLGTYLNGDNAWQGGTPLWLQELTKNQPINSSDYREYWVDYYREEKILADAISEAIKRIADSKKKTFISQPTDSDSYKVGDMWVNAYYDDGVTIYVDETLVCVQDKNAGEAFSISHWGLSNGYSASIRNLGDSIELAVQNHNQLSTEVAKIEVKIGEINQYVANVEGSASNAKELADAAKGIAQNAMMSGMYGSETYSQTTNPWNNWFYGTEYKHVGALWYNPDTKETKRYVGTDGSDSWETVEGSAYFLATYVYQNNGQLSAIAAKFDADGNPTTASGFVTKQNFAGIFSEEIGVTKAEIGTFITKDEAGKLISGATIKADQIELEGYTTINGNFSVDNSGNVTVKGKVEADKLLLTTKAWGGNLSDYSLGFGGGDYVLPVIDPSSNNVFREIKLFAPNNSRTAVKFTVAVGDSSNESILYSDADGTIKEASTLSLSVNVLYTFTAMPIATGYFNSDYNWFMSAQYLAVI